MPTVTDFSLEVAADRGASYDTLLHKGRRVADVEARVVEAQFRLPNGSSLVMLSDDQAFKEMLTILLISPALKVLDRMQLGGAFTPGFLTYAYPVTPEEIAFCWHDLDQVVRVRRHRTMLGLRSRWLSVREVPVDLPDSPRAYLPKLRELRALLPEIKRPQAPVWLQKLRRH